MMGHKDSCQFPAPVSPYDIYEEWVKGKVMYIKAQLLPLPYSAAIFGTGALDLLHVTTKNVTSEQVEELESDF